MVVGLGGGETIGYLVEYLNETQKRCKCSDTFIRERTGWYSSCHCIYKQMDTLEQLKMVIQKMLLNYEIGDMEAYVTKI